MPGWSSKCGGLGCKAVRGSSNNIQHYATLTLQTTPLTTDRMAATTTKVMRFAEGQKQMLNSLKQNFSQKTEEGESSFSNFETLLESLTSMDLENKKLVLDQVSLTVISLTTILKP